MSDKRRSDPWGYGMEHLPKVGKLPCFDCGTETTGRHHVVPVSLGGKRQVPLYEECHNLVHGDTMKRAELIRMGLDRDKSKGVRFGAPNKVNEKLKIKARMLRKDGLTIKAIAKEMKLSVGTVHSMVTVKKARSNNSMESTKFVGSYYNH